MSVFAEQVRAYLQDKEMDKLKELLNQQELHQLLELFFEFEGTDNLDEMLVLFRLLNKDLSLAVFEQLSVDLQEKLIYSFTDEKSIELVLGMEPDDRARLMDELPAKVAKKLLNKLTPEERGKTSILLGYAPRTAGRIMTPEYVSLKAEMTAEEALEKIRRERKSAETVYVLYVTDANRKLLGVLSLGELVSAAKSARIGDIMTETIAKVDTDTDQEDVARLLQDRDLLAVPVVDRENRLVGIVTVDDAIDVLEEETTDDIFDKVGLTNLTSQETGRSQRLVTGSTWEVWKVRIPFLIITLIGGMLAGAVIDAYEETLEAVAAVAIFIPVIMDMGGNVGTQSSTIFTRAFVLGHINVKRFGSHFLREVKIGFSMGVIMGIAAGIIATLWQQDPNFGLAVGVSLALTMTIATSMGFLVPFVLVRMGFDQAAGSDPFITTIKDVTGLFIYFTSVSIFLGHLL